MRKVILCGASCSGKTTIKQMLVDQGFLPGVSYTTRSMRPGEIEGTDYRFISKERFVELIESGFFFEYDDAFEDYYGTSNEDFQRYDVFILTPKAVRKLKDSGLLSDCVVIQLTAPLHERIKRAFERGDSIGKIMGRISADNKTFSGFSDYDMVLENRDGNIEELLTIIKKQ